MVSFKKPVENTAPSGILIVEDESEIRTLMGFLFASENFVVYEETNGEVALEVFKQHQDEIGLLITDLGLPGIGGLQLIAEVRRLKPSMKIIGTSGYGRVNVRDEVLRAGGDEFVAKPFNVDDVMRLSKTLLGRE